MDETTLPLELFSHLQSKGGAELEAALDRSERWMVASATLLNGVSFPPSTRIRAAISLFQLCEEHHQAIQLLLSNGLVGSALALKRPQLEAYIRGLWIYHCASEEKIIAFLQKSGELPKFGAMIADIEKVKEFSGGELSDIKQSIYKLVNDYTHGGAVQVLARNSQDEVISNYRPEDAIWLLNGSVALSHCAAIATAVAVEDIALQNKLLQAYKEIHQDVELGEAT